jgi:hypothetical protein
MFNCRGSCSAAPAHKLTPPPPPPPPPPPSLPLSPSAHKHTSFRHRSMLLRLKTAAVLNLRSLQGAPIDHKTCFQLCTRRCHHTLLSSRCRLKCAYAICTATASSSFLRFFCPDYSVPRANHSSTAPKSTHAVEDAPSPSPPPITRATASRSRRGEATECA